MDSLAFWIIAGALALVAATVLARAALRGRDIGAAPAAYDLQVYRDQLKEIDRDATRGIVAPDEAERLKAEVARRILAADSALTAQQAAVAPVGPVRGMIAVAGVMVVAGALALYAQLGAPGYGDLALQTRIAAAEEARQNRPAQAAAEAQVQAQAQRPQVGGPQPDAAYSDLMNKLRATVAERPNDLHGHQLLARNEAALGNFTAAYAAQERILAIKGDRATAQDYLDYTDMLILAAGGYVSPEAEQALAAALARDPQNGAARYYVGLMMAQTGRPDRAFTLWDGLLRAGPPDAPWIGPIRAQMADIAWRAGQVRYELPPEADAPAAAATGPSAADIAAPADLSPEQRQDMIRGMVDGLAARLAADGGAAPDWARLINALGNLGEIDRARAILAEARQKFAAEPAALAGIEDAARAAGVTP